jgi:hypothetical protein
MTEDLYDKHSNREIRDWLGRIHQRNDKGLYDTIDSMLMQSAWWDIARRASWSVVRHRPSPFTIFNSPPRDLYDRTYSCNNVPSLRIDTSFQRKMLLETAVAHTPVEFFEILKYGFRAGFKVYETEGECEYRIDEPDPDWPK